MPTARPTHGKGGMSLGRTAPPAKGPAPQAGSPQQGAGSPRQRAGARSSAVATAQRGLRIPRLGLVGHEVLQ